MQSRLSFTITPHKVALCILIQDSCTPERMSASARPMLSIFLLEHVRQAQDYKEKTLAELCDALSSLEPLGRGLASQLVHSLRKITSPDDLFDTLHALELLLLDSAAVDDEIPGLDSSSVLGVFLRKVRTIATTPERSRETDTLSTPDLASLT
ncbi:hypothetical protein T484DRAFT_1771238 [Baffinella frigidus]|nr:hypothetical protein T484DRAFT_1771238 [Cryptophyta sp. CCMP2293]